MPFSNIVQRTRTAKTSAFSSLVPLTIEFITSMLTVAFVLVRNTLWPVYSRKVPCSTTDLDKICRVRSARAIFLLLKPLVKVTLAHISPWPPSAALNSSALWKTQPRNRAQINYLITEGAQGVVEIVIVFPFIFEWGRKWHLVREKLSGKNVVM